MKMDERFKKISWIFEMPEVFQNDVVVTKRLDEISGEAQKDLIHMTMNALIKNFNHSECYMGKVDNAKAKAIEFQNQLTIWISGLCDVSIAQIVNALVDILEMKTEYQQFPPRSVMAFYAICKKPRPEYYTAAPIASDSVRIGYDKAPARARSEAIAAKSLAEMFQILGKKYEQARLPRIGTRLFISSS